MNFFSELDRKTFNFSIAGYSWAFYKSLRKAFLTPYSVASHQNQTNHKSENDLSWTELGASKSHQRTKKLHQQAQKIQHAWTQYTHAQDVENAQKPERCHNYSPLDWAIKGEHASTVSILMNTGAVANPTNPLLQSTNQNQSSGIHRLFKNISTVAQSNENERLSAALH